jgi:hypothetical protein
MTKPHVPYVLPQLSQQVLRTRPAPDEVAELLLIVNKVPRTLLKTHRLILNSRALGIDERGVQVLLEQIVESLPTELRVFVKPEDGLLKNEAEGWRKVLGPLLFDCALGASGGLFPVELTATELEKQKELETTGQISFPNQGKPFFGLGEVESMRQRYLFLFAMRALLEAISEAHVSLEKARYQLQSLHLQPSASALSPPLAEVEALRGRFDFGKRDHKKKTHSLGYAKPQITWVLEKIELERIRKCPVCETLFWAGRLDQSACRPRCANVLRAKTWREKYAAKNKRKERNRKARLFNETKK